MNDNLIFRELVRRCPDCDRVAAYRLAGVWSMLLDRIIARMFDICESEVGLCLHIDQRAEAAVELAQLSLFLGKAILDEKAKRKALDKYDPDDEAALLETKEEQTKINNTARNMADGVWKPLIDKWRKRRPLVETPGRPLKLHKPARPAFREHMHYVPQFTIRQWTSAKSGKFMVYTIDLNGEVRGEASTAKLWGAAPSLHPARQHAAVGRVDKHLPKSADPSDTDPYSYLADVLCRLVNLWPNARLDELLPWNWAAAPDHLQRAA